MMLAGSNMYLIGLKQRALDENTAQLLNIIYAQTCIKNVCYALKTCASGIYLFLCGLGVLYMKFLLKGLRNSHSIVLHTGVCEED